LPQAHQRHTVLVEIQQPDSFGKITATSARLALLRIRFHHLSPQSALSEVVAVRTIRGLAKTAREGQFPWTVILDLRDLFSTNPMPEF